MAAFKVVLALSLVAVALCRPDTPYGKEPGMPYDFAYAVKDEYSGNDFGHNEQSDGNVVQGSYFVQLPDGRLQTVSFTADHDQGYVADVHYAGEAQYPQVPANGYGQ